MLVGDYEHDYSRAPWHFFSCCSCFFNMILLQPLVWCLSVVFLVSLIFFLQLLFQYYILAAFGLVSFCSVCDDFYGSSGADVTLMYFCLKL